MLKRLLLCQVTILALLLSGLPVSQAQTSFIIRRGEGRGPRPVRISSYDDDPFVADSIIERMAPARFGREEDGSLILRGNQVQILDEPFVYRMNPQTGVFEPFATNPWPEPVANADGDFQFPHEARIPRHEIERDADGRPVLNEEGLQIWKPRDIRRGMSTAFEAAHAAKDAVEFWAGRGLLWGEDGRLLINAHTFIGFNAFYSPSARGLFFGVVPYRLPGETGVEKIKMFETATSWEIAAHEAGHALHAELKPNRAFIDPGYRTWTESFSDQVEMWASLRDAERLRNLLAETHGDLNQSNSLTRIAEVLGKLVGDDNDELRDAFHDKKVTDTSTEQHDRSEVLTGACYRVFLKIFDELKNEYGAEEALRQAGQIMGVFVTRANDYMPENRMTLEDVAKAYLKVDSEFFGSRYHAMLVDEFMRRELFDTDSVSEWFAHEAALPTLWLPPYWPDDRMEQLIQANLDKLGIGPEFGLKLHSVTRIQQFSQFRQSIPTRGPAQAIVRVQLTEGRGADATPLDNHGILVFHAGGMLRDYHAPLPPESGKAHLAQAAQPGALLFNARRLRLDQHGAPLSIVRRSDGRLTVETRVLRGKGINSWMEVFTFDNPRGERREIVIPPVPESKRLRIAEDLLN